MILAMFPLRLFYVVELPRVIATSCTKFLSCPLKLAAGDARVHNS